MDKVDTHLTDIAKSSWGRQASVAVHEHSTEEHLFIQAQLRSFCEENPIFSNDRVLLYSLVSAGIRYQQDKEKQDLRPQYNRNALYEQLHKKLTLYKDYLHACLGEEDWHGVMDASADIREYLAKLEMLDEVGK